MLGKSLGFLVMVSFFSTPLTAKNSHAQIEQKVAKVANGNLEFQLIVKPNAKLVINEDAPWQLSIKKNSGLEFLKPKLNKQDFKSNLPGFIFATAKKPSAQTGMLELEVVSFVCTADKAQCYRDVDQVKVAWKN